METTKTTTTTSLVEVFENLPPVQSKELKLADWKRFRDDAVPILEKFVAEAKAANDVPITTHEDWAARTALLKAVGIGIKSFDAKIEEILSPLRAEKREADAVKRDFINPLEKISDEINSKVTAYKLEVERKRREEEEARIAEQKRREEAIRKEREAREAEELRAKQEFERKQREFAAEQKRLDAERRKREEDARIQQALAAEKEGDLERAKEILETPTAVEILPVVPAPVRPPSMTAALPPKPAAILAPIPEVKTQALPDMGDTVVKRLKGKINDPYKVLELILEDKDKPEDEKRVPISAIEFREPWFNDRARVLKGLMSKLIPGTEAVPEGKTQFRNTR